MIGLIVDNPRRDLEGAFLVAAELARKGRKAALIPLYTQGFDVPLLGLDGVVLNYLRLNNRQLAQTYRSLGMRLFVMDTEGGVLSSDGADAPHNWGGWLAETGLGALADRYFCWGEAVESAFAAAMPAGDFVATGCPRYDLCAPRLRGYFRFPLRDFVLVNTNFSAVNPSFQSGAEAEKRAFATAGFSPDYVETLLAELTATFERFRAALKSLARALPERQFVLRPHPFENHEIYRRDFAGIANVTVNGEGSVFHAIANAACIVHLNCGTAVESLLMGKVPINLAYLSSPVQDAHTPLPRELSLNAASEAEAIAAIADIARTERDFPWAERRERFVRPWFHTVDGGAARRVADGIIETLGTGGAGGRRSVGAALRAGHGRPSTGQRAGGLLATAVGSLAAEAVRTRLKPSRRGKHFSATEVGAIAEGLAAADPAYRGLDVRQARSPLTGLPLASVIVSA